MKPDVACGAGRCPDLSRKACVCLHCQQAHGRCQERQDWMAGCEALTPGLPWREQEETAPSGQRSLPLHPQGAGWETQRLTYWKGRRMARMSPLKKRVMSSTKSTPWQDVKSNCRDGMSVSCRAPEACTGWLGIPLGPWPDSVLAGRLRPLGQATFQGSPQNLAFLPIYSRCPPHRLLILVTSPQPGIQARSLHPTCLPGPAGPRADLGLEAEDGDREADEGRDAQAQQHRRGVVVTAGPAGRGSASGQGFWSPPALLPGPPPSART